MRVITVRAPVNIAVIKYWGKRDEALNLPLNDSISGTLSMEHLCATTTIAVSDRFERDRFWLNAQESPINERLQRCLQLMRRLVGNERWPDDHHLHIVSKNNFPTAAGLASSAAGFAAIAFALCKLFNNNAIDANGDGSDGDRIREMLKHISTIARLGSGSACRSIAGGFVHWIAGDRHENSIATPIIAEHDWPEMRVLLVVFSEQRKDTPSTDGMRRTAATSELIRERVETIVPARCEQMIGAICDRDFHRFADLTMRDSNQFHAICGDTYPPIRYMSDRSWTVIGLVHEYNRLQGRNVAAYTFDAGPNACIYCLAEHVPTLLSLIERIFCSADSLMVKGDAVCEPRPELSPDLLKLVATFRRDSSGLSESKKLIEYVINTKLGPGAEVITTEIDDPRCLVDRNGAMKTDAGI